MSRIESRIKVTLLIRKTICRHADAECGGSCTAGGAAIGEKECNDMWNRQSARQLLLRGYRDLRIRTAAVVMFALTWWGVLYPELCFTESTYEQIMVVDGQEIILEETDIEDILNATGDEVVVKSRLLEWLEQLFHKEES